MTMAPVGDPSHFAKAPLPQYRFPGTQPAEHPCVKFNCRSLERPLGAAQRTVTKEKLAMSIREVEIAKIRKDWNENARWKGIKRSYTPEDVYRLRGSLQ